MKWFRFRKKDRIERNDPGQHEDVRDWLASLRGMQGDLARTVEGEASRQRREQGEALLAERLRCLAQASEGPALDDKLISNAEYQLYLDERRAAGEALQPDHWLNRAFPWGKGSAPILGVRYQDAVAFCQWLTGRADNGSTYRLPHSDEPGLDRAPRSVRLGLLPGGGYWATAAEGEGQLVQLSHRGCTLSGADLAAWMERDLAAGRDLFVESVLAQGRDLTSALGLDPDLDRAEARELALLLAEALDRAQDRAQKVDRRLAEALAEAMEGVRRIDYALDGGAARDVGAIIDTAHDLSRALTVAHYRTHALPRARGLARVMSRVTDRGRDLHTAIARAGASDVVRILMLTGNRTSAVDRAHVLAQDILPNLEPAADLAADLAFAHTLSRIRELDLALMLVRACDIFRPFDLDRLAAGGVRVDLDRRGDELAREISRIRAIRDDPDLDHAGAHTMDRAQAHVLEQTLARDLGLVRALVRCGNLAREHAFACLSAGRSALAWPSAPGQPGALDWPHALGLLVDRNLSNGLAAEGSRYLRMYVRLGALACAIEVGALLQAPPDLWTDRPLEAQRDAALDVYIQLGILEDRIEGHLPAWEGIRVVAEKRGIVSQVQP